MPDPSVPAASLEQRIRQWQADDKQGYDVAIELLCEAAEAIAVQREALEWVASYYDGPMREAGCPCDKEAAVVCPLHAALSAAPEGDK